MKVHITFHSVKGLPGHEGITMNKADPYVEAKYSLFHHFKTQYKKDAGHEAAFEETWTFDTDSHDSINIKVKDNRHLRVDELLAEGVYKFTLQSGFHWSGEVGLVAKHRGCKQPCLRITCQVE